MEQVKVIVITTSFFQNNLALIETYVIELEKVTSFCKQIKLKTVSLKVTVTPKMYCPKLK